MNEEYSHRGLAFQPAAQHRLVTWSEWHAYTMLVSTLAGLFVLPFSIFILASFISFTALIINCRPYWTPKCTFGIANAVTSLRLGGAYGLIWQPTMDYEWIILISIAILSLDGLDGYLARKKKLACEFGEYYDKEVDAFFVLTLCILLYIRTQFSAWILLPGLMRYAFVIYIKFAKPRAYKEKRRSLGKWVFFAMISVLIFDLTPFSRFAFPLTLSITGLLLYSFLLSIFEAHRHSETRINLTDRNK